MTSLGCGSGRVPISEDLSELYKFNVGLESRKHFFKASDGYVNYPSSVIFDIVVPTIKVKRDGQDQLFSFYSIAGYRIGV